MKIERKKKVVLMKGLGVSSGIAIGRAFVFERGGVDAPHYCHLDPSAVDMEIDRFKRALDESHTQLERIKKRLDRTPQGREHVRIIDAHLMILKDHTLINDTMRVIKEDRVNAEWAIKNVLKGVRELFDRMDDEYFKERGYDIEHTMNRILVNLMGAKHESVADIKEPSVVIAHDLAPTDTAQMVKGRVLAFVTDVGGRTSHTTIMARSLEIPAVVALESVSRQVESGDMVIVDGTSGTVIINPSKSVINLYEKRRQRYERYGKTLHHYRNLPSETPDGRRIRLMGNIELVEELNSLTEHGADGIGLYRTEFLYLNRKDLPTEDEHLGAYREVVRHMSPNPVTIRTFDIGGDKFLSEMDVAEEINPAMGLRAIRFCFKRPDIFKTQLRGILRASVYGKIKVMFPMISGVEELRRAKELLAEARAELKSEGKGFDPDIKVGAMIEVPSAAMISDLLAKEADFFSIGTNDLLQYSLAIDRVNEHVAYLYEPLHPAVLRLIKQIVVAGHKAGIEVSVCGEMAGEPAYSFIFLGMGIDSLSMNALSILKVKRLIRSVTYAEARKVCSRILRFSTAREVEEYLYKKLPAFSKEEF